MVKRTRWALVALVSMVAASCSGSSGGGAVAPPAAVNLTGTWFGFWQSEREPTAGGVIELELSQTGNTLAASYTATNAQCVPFGSGGGTVIDQDVSLVFDDGTQVLAIDGTHNQGVTLKGAYTIQGGACHGDVGRWILTRVE